MSAASSGSALAIYGVPVGVISPSHQAAKMPVNSKMDRPTRNASDLAMYLARSLLLLSFFIMKTSAEARLPRIPTKAKMTMYFMNGIIT